MLGNSISEFALGSTAIDVFQNIRSISDVTKGPWLPRTGTDLYPMLNAGLSIDHIYTLNPNISEIAEVTLALNAENPDTNEDHYFQYEGQGNYTVSLMQGTLTIASWSENDEVDTFHVKKLTTVQVDNITDYSDLSVKIVTNT
jgi:hypothetical protein